MEDNKKNNTIHRREFLKRLGGSAVVASSVVAAGCSGDKQANRYVAEGIGGEVPTDNDKERKG